MDQWFWYIHSLTMITQDKLKELFEYSTDGNLIWKVQKAKRTKIGSIAGWINTDVHRQKYMNVELDGKSYKLHRIIFMYHYGFMPKRIDHVDGNRLNNRIENLREATASQNAMNSSVRNHSKSGIKNVFLDKASNKWRVQFKINGKNYSFGSYNDLEIADLVAQEARSKYHGAFARNN